jgi:hypothetical protein
MQRFNRTSAERKEGLSFGDVEVEAEAGGEEWSRGLERAVRGVAMTLIAKDRVRKLRFF